MGIAHVKMFMLFWEWFLYISIVKYFDSFKYSSAKIEREKVSWYNIIYIITVCIIF